MHSSVDVWYKWNSVSRNDQESHPRNMLLLWTERLTQMTYFLWIPLKWLNKRGTIPWTHISILRVEKNHWDGKDATSDDINKKEKTFLALGKKNSKSRPQNGTSRKCMFLSTLPSFSTSPLKNRVGFDLACTNNGFFSLYTVGYIMLKSIQFQTELFWAFWVAFQNLIDSNNCVLLVASS